MAIDRIPGVGPQNSDIAAAVAAPSAATIAAAVAAPSAATIAAAVAAPSAATIATQVAASVPTLSQINTSVANNAPSPNNWVLLGTGNLQNVTTSTVNFSSYRALRIIYRFVNSPQDCPVFRLNGDSSFNYTIGSFNFSTTSAANSNSNTSFPLTNNFENAASSANIVGSIEIDQTNLTSLKLCKIRTWYSSTAGARYSEIDGFYNSAAAITSFTILSNGGNTYNNSGFNAVAFQVFGAN